MSHIKNFKRILFSAVALIASATTPALANDVGMSISIGQPGFYGRLDIGDYPYPQPRLIYNNPIIVHRSSVMYEPLYLRVPPGHAKRWHYYCDRYEACGRPVYFVQDTWYHNVYIPQYRERHGDNEWHDRDGGRGGEWRDDNRGRSDYGRNEGRNHGHDNGRGREHGHGHDRD